MADGGKVSPEVGAQSWIRAGINTSTCGNGIATLDSEGNGGIVEVNNSSSRSGSCILEKPDTPRMTLSFNNVNRTEPINCKETT
jgi:hypothetical protein